MLPLVLRLRPGRTSLLRACPAQGAVRHQLPSCAVQRFLQAGLQQAQAPARLVRSLSLPRQQRPCDLPPRARGQLLVRCAPLVQQALQVLQKSGSCPGHRQSPVLSLLQGLQVLRELLELRRLRVFLLAALPVLQRHCVLRSCGQGRESAPGESRCLQGRRPRCQKQALRCPGLHLLSGRCWSAGQAVRQSGAPG